MKSILIVLINNNIFENEEELSKYHGTLAENLANFPWDIDQNVFPP